MANRKTWLQQKLFGQGPVIAFLWGMLLITAITAVFSGRLELGFVAVATLALAMAPALLASKLEIVLPVPFVAAITLFVFSSLFLGEAFDFYNRFWWWDKVLHGVSAIGFGMIGFLFAFMLFEGDRYAAPPAALSLIAFCVAITVGSLWEVFEYLMDTFFGMNMQKTGLDDTMEDIMVNAVGATIGSLSGYYYLKGHRFGLTQLIGEFVRLNRQLYRKSKEQLRKINKD
ncbi:hypothetical protein [Yoonia sp.]|uniref:hypothetical protein n=1 Tax=Yoonia sp. TaxID=2212373 RepID=UPI0019FB158D|nr:hypothetical protein [Yoonia sp.]MBE0414570.1 hypothetical protein [Yoonia sp.]